MLENPGNDIEMTILCLCVPEIETVNFGAKIVRHLVCVSRDIRRADVEMSKLGTSCSKTPKMTIKLQINMFFDALLKKYVLLKL